MSMIHKREEWGKDLESENFEGCYWLNSLRNHSGWGNVDCVSLKRGCFFSSVQFSSVAQSYATLRPHGLQHARPPWPSPAPRAYSSSLLLHPPLNSHSSNSSSSIVTSYSFWNCFRLENIKGKEREKGRFIEGLWEEQKETIGGKKRWQGKQKVQQYFPTSY